MLQRKGAVWALRLLTPDCCLPDVFLIEYSQPSQMLGLERLISRAVA